MADTYKQELDDLAGLFAAGWQDATPVAWPNVAFEPEHGKPWVRFTVQTGEARQASIGCPGSNYFRYTGVIDISIFTPLNEGDSEALDLAEKALGIFHDAVLSGYVFSAGYVGQGGYVSSVIVENSSGTRGWEQKNVRIPYRRDSLK